MTTFKRLVQNPSSPDKNIKAAGLAGYKQSTFARLADTNALSRNINDQILYTLPLIAAANGTQAITTKRGVIKITTSQTGPLTITLTNSEFLLADVDKYYVQVSIAHPTINAGAIVLPITADGSMAIRISHFSGTAAWVTVYLNYEIVKIGD
jgi:hypothetical protein